MRNPKHAFAWLIAKDDRIRMEFSEEMQASLRMNPRRYGVLAEALRRVSDQLEKQSPKITKEPTPKKIVDTVC